MAHSLLKEEFEFDQRKQVKMPERILATEKSSKTQVTTHRGGNDDVCELESLSDIDESMERYMKYRKTSRKRQTSKGAKEVSSVASQSAVVQEESLPSSSRGKSRDPHIKISALLQKQNEKMREAQIFKNDYTTIEVDASNDNNTSIQNLRKQMSKHRQSHQVESPISDLKQEPVVSSDPTADAADQNLNRLGVNRFSYKELMNMHRDKLEELEKKNSQQQLTSRNQVSEKDEVMVTEVPLDGRNSVQLSYVQSSLENTQTRRSRPMQPSMQGISKYQTTDYNISEANEENVQNDQLELNETDILIQSLNEPSGSAQSSPDNYRKQTDVADFKEFTIKNEEESMEETKKRIKEIGMSYGMSEPRFNVPEIQTSLVSHKVVRDVSKDLIDIQVIMANNNQVTESDYDLHLVNEYDCFGNLPQKPSTIQEADTQQELDTEDINGTEHTYGDPFKLNARSRHSLGRYSIGQRDTGFPSRNESALEVEDDQKQLSSRKDDLKRIWVKNITNSSYKSLDKEEKQKFNRADHLASMKQIEPANAGSLFHNFDQAIVKKDRNTDQKQLFMMTGDIPQSTTTFANQQLGATGFQSNHMTLQSHQSSSAGGQYQSLRNRSLKASDLQEPAEIKQKYDQMVYSNPQFGNKNKKVIPKVPKAKSPPLFEIPDQKLMVVCLIKREADAGEKQGRSRSVKVHPRLGRTSELHKGGQKRFASNQNLASQRDRSNSTLGNKSMASSRSYGASSHCSSQLIHGQRPRQPKLQGVSSVESQDGHTASAPRSQLLFFTTHNECSQYVFRQAFSDQFEPVSNKIITATLRTSSDVPQFVSGVQQHKPESEEPRLRMFQFDKCISSYQHQKKMRMETHAMIRAWLLATENEGRSRTNHVCFLFGSASTSKSRDMNLMHADSLIQQFIREFPDRFDYLKVSMFFQDQEFVLNQREFNSSKQSNREIGMEIRESLRDKNRLIGKLSAQQPELQVYIQKCSHFRIQINNYVFLDMADLRGLQSTDNQEIVDTLTNDFGSMTNEILRHSPFYSSHSFSLTQLQEASSLNNFLMNTISIDSKILLMTYINNSAEDDITNSIALDFSHKIKQYFNGNSDECQIYKLIRADDQEEAQIQFEKLDMMFKKVSKMKQRVRRELSKAKRLCVNNVTRLTAVPTGSQQRFAQLFDAFSGFVNEVLEYDLVKTFDQAHVKQIKGIIDADMLSLQHQVNEIARRQEKHQIQVANFIRLHGHQVAPVTATKPKRPKKSVSPKLRDYECNIVNQAPSALSMNKIKMITQSVNSSLQTHKVSMQSGAVPRSGSNLGFKNVNRTQSSLIKDTASDRDRGKRAGSNGQAASSKTRKKSVSRDRKPRPKAGNRLKTSSQSHNSQNSFASRKQTQKLPSQQPNLQNMIMKMEDQSKIAFEQIEATNNYQLVASFQEPSRAKLASDIDKGLSRIKQKRAQANDCHQDDQDEDTHLTTRMSDKLVSLSDIKNDNVISGTHIIYSERQQLMRGQNDQINIYEGDEDLVPQKDESKQLRPEQAREKPGKVSRLRSKSKSTLVRGNSGQNSMRSKSREANMKCNQKLQGLPVEFQRTGPSANPGITHRGPYEDMQGGNSLLNRNLDQFCSPDLLSSQTSNTQNLMLNNTTDRYNQYQTKAIQNEIKHLQQQLQFQKSEYETALAMKDMELMKQNQVCNEARKELKVCMKQNKELTLQHEDLLSKLSTLKAQKEKTESLNQQILDQIKLMKSAIQEQRQTEQMNKQLLEKARVKTDQIQELRDSQSKLMEQLKSKNETIKQLTRKVTEMEQRYVTLGGSQENEFEQMYFELKKKYEKEVQEHAKYMKEVQTNSTNAKTRKDEDERTEANRAAEREEQMQELLEEIDSLKKARDRFRSQVLDQKQEIRNLKTQLQESQCQALRQDSDEKGHHKVISELEAASAYQDCLKLDLTLSQNDSKGLNYNSMVSDAKLSSISNQIKSQVAKCKGSERNENVQTEQKENSHIFNQVISFGNQGAKIASQSAANHNSNVSRKNEVIADIKSLIKDFKRDISK